MSNANEPAYPTIETRPEYDREYNSYSNTYSVGGLTKREYFAAMAMQGLLSRVDGWGAADLASASAHYADAILAELERTA